MNIKEEILSRLNEMLNMEENARGMYMEIVSSLEIDAMKSFFLDIAREEAQHAELVKELISLVKGG